MEHTDKQKEREGNRLRPRTLTAHDFAWVCVCALFLSLSLPVLCCAFRECQRVKVCHRYTTRVVTTTKRLQYNRRVVFFFFFFHLSLVFCHLKLLLAILLFNGVSTTGFLYPSPLRGVWKRGKTT